MSYDSLTSEFTFIFQALFFLYWPDETMLWRGSMHKKKSSEGRWKRASGSGTKANVRRPNSSQSLESPLTVAPANARTCWITKSAKAQTQTSDSKSSCHSWLPCYLACLRPVLFDTYPVKVICSRLSVASLISVRFHSLMLRVIEGRSIQKA